MNMKINLDNNKYIDDKSMLLIPKSGKSINNDNMLYFNSFLISEVNLFFKNDISRIFIITIELDIRIIIITS